MRRFAAGRLATVIFLQDCFPYFRKGELVTSYIEDDNVLGGGKLRINPDVSIFDRYVNGEGKEKVNWRELTPLEQLAKAAESPPKQLP